MRVSFNNPLVEEPTGRGIHEIEGGGEPGKNAVLTFLENLQLRKKYKKNS